jgi:signal transduction histidine kinase
MHLTQRLRSVASELLPPRGIALAFAVEDGGQVALGADVRRQVFLIAKESLNNIVKHSGATEARVTGTITPVELRLVIEDNGRGIGAGAAASSSGHGLSSMRRRADGVGGTLELKSHGAGTRLTLVVPLS